MTDERFQKAELTVGLAIAGNIALACLKGIVGFLAQSTALLADAAHSASDAVRSASEWMKIRTTVIPPEEATSHGQSRKISISTIFLSIVILVLGVEMGISSLKSLWAGTGQAPRFFVLAAIVISIMVKEIIFQYTFRLGKRLNAQDIIANARGHRSDIYSSFVALIGVAGSLGGHYANVTFLYYLDSIAGLVISVMVFTRGCLFVLEALHTKNNDVLQQENTAELIAAVQVIKGIITVDELKAREQGHYIVIEVKISVNPRTSVWEGHELSKKVKQQLMKRFHHVSDVFVHVAPYDAGFPYKHNIDTEHSEFPSVIH